jgi:hypothetical protein
MELVTVTVRFREGNISFRYYGLITIGFYKKSFVLCKRFSGECT